MLQCINFKILATLFGFYHNMTQSEKQVPSCNSYGTNAGNLSEKNIGWKFDLSNKYDGQGTKKYDLIELFWRHHIDSSAEFNIPVF